MRPKGVYSGDWTNSWSTYKKHIITKHIPTKHIDTKPIV